MHHFSEMSCAIIFRSYIFAKIGRNHRFAITYLMRGGGMNTDQYAETTLLNIDGSGSGYMLGLA